MTREEEIKARLACKIACYCDVKKGKQHDFYLALPDDKMEGVAANSDIRYLLARNEELQRRVKKMQAVVDAATWLMECYSVEAFDKNDAVIEIMESTDKAFVDLASTIDAKGQGDD